MLNKNVCPNCGQLYDNDLSKCPLCGTAPQVVDTESPVQRKRITEAERRQRRADRKEAEQEARRRRRDAQFMQDAEEERLLEEEEARRKEEKRRLKEEKKAARRAAREEAEAARAAREEAEAGKPAPDADRAVPAALPEEEPGFTAAPARDGRKPMPEDRAPKDRRRVPRGLLIPSFVLLLAALVVGGSYLLWKLQVVDLPIYDKLASQKAAQTPEGTAPADPAGTAPAGTQAVTQADTQAAQTGAVPCKALTLDRTEAVFAAAGDQLQISVTQDPADTTDELVYVSSDEGVVKVSSVGILTAVAPGSATVTVTCGGVKAECAVVCDFAETADSQPVSVDVDSLELVKDDMSFFAPGENYVLSVTNLPAGTPVTWTSQDESIATVDEKGHVVAVGAGTTKIIAAVGDKTGECIVRCKFE